MTDNQWIDFYYSDSKDQSFFREFVAKQDEVYYKKIRSSDDSSNYILLRKQPEKILQIGLPVIEQPKNFFLSKLPNKNTFPIKPQLKAPFMADWVFYILLIAWSFFAIIRYAYPKRLNQAVKSVFAKRFYQQLLREGDYKLEPLAFLLNIVYIMSFSLTFFMIIQKKGAVDFFGIKGVYFYLVLFILLFTLFIAKQFAVKFIGFIFKTKSDSSEYLLNNLLINHLLGIVILPFIVFYCYTSSMVTFWMLIVLIIFSFGYRIFRGFILGTSNNKFSLFYLFLYLCTVEILPIIFSIRLITSIFAITM